MFGCRLVVMSLHLNLVYLPGRKCPGRVEWRRGGVMQGQSRASTESGQERRRQAEVMEKRGNRTQHETKVGVVRRYYTDNGMFDMSKRNL